MAKRTDFRSEIKRLEQGIRVAWFINFAIIWVLVIAIGVVFGLSTRVSNAQLAQEMLVFAGIGLVVALIIMAVVSGSAERILLSAPAGDAVEVTNGQLKNIVEEMAIAAALEQQPRVYILRGSGVCNAYASADSKGNSMVVVTEELLDLLNTREELEGVIAHEIGHIKTGDSQAMTKLVALTSTTAIIGSMASRMLFFGGGRRNSDSNNSNGTNPIAIVIIVLSYIFLIAAPFLSKIAESYMSRERESRADASAVEFTRNPTGIAQALIALENGADHYGSKSEAKNFGETIGPVAFYNPSFAGLDLSSHPSTKKRVAALKAMGAQVDDSSL
ncbi:M48 family metalloprotease [Lactococcus termiticola]|uniref:Heat-shock protein HtpX n=1 Tax=Lactococcus termiticola TaxID=2169526 RepID=A0A2R5HIF8_9LACT|nr:M48 family metalloprotease [Lactococcus termiticola]GBG97335.1 heat-shock protein HtpX [Lactococcus termiticola]